MVEAAGMVVGAGMVEAVGVGIVEAGAEAGIVEEEAEAGIAEIEAAIAAAEAGTAVVVVVGEIAGPMQLERAMAEEKARSWEQEGIREPRSVAEAPDPSNIVGCTAAAMSARQRDAPVPAANCCPAG